MSDYINTIPLPVSPVFIGITGCVQRISMNAGKLYTQYSNNFSKNSEKLRKDINHASEAVGTFLSDTLDAGFSLATSAKVEGLRLANVAKDEGVKLYDLNKTKLDNKIEELTPKLRQFIQENPNEVSTGAAIFGGVAVADGVHHLAKGNKVLGLIELFFGAISFATAGYIQKETIVNPLVAYAKPIISDIPTIAQNAKNLINASFNSNPEISTLSGAAGGLFLVLGSRNILRGNIKLGLTEFVTGAGAVALSIYGLKQIKQGICLAS